MTFLPEEVACLFSAKTSNEENYLMQKFARDVLKTPNIDHCARLLHYPQSLVSLQFSARGP